MERSYILKSLKKAVTSATLNSPGAPWTHTPEPFCFYYILTVCKVKETKTVVGVERWGAWGSVPCLTLGHME